MVGSSFIGTPQNASDHYWGIILAGGEGTRLQHYLQTHLGESRPKQFCSILGKRSMLQHTLNRASFILRDDHIVTTIGKRHLRYAEEYIDGRPPQTVILQPDNKETAPGILLPLLHVHHRDPEAVVALFPSDHFIIGEDRFMEHVNEAFRFAVKHPKLIVVLTFEPNSLQHGYGWMEKGKIVEMGDHYSFYKVQKFWEKPDEKLKVALHEKKCVWNTFTIVGTANALLGLYKEHLGGMYGRFEQLRNVIETSDAERMVESIFADLPTVNFSQAVLEQVPEKLAMLPLKGIYWSDWGDEQRIMDDIAFLTGTTHTALEFEPKY